MPKTIEEIYQKKTPKEHILLRPDTYIGSVEIDTQSAFVWDNVQEKIVLKNVKFAPGLYKIFRRCVCRDQSYRKLCHGRDE